MELTPLVSQPTICAAHAGIRPDGDSDSAVSVLHLSACIHSDVVLLLLLLLLLPDDAHRDLPSSFPSPSMPVRRRPSSESSSPYYVSNNPYPREMTALCSVQGIRHRAARVLSWTMDIRRRGSLPIQDTVGRGLPTPCWLLTAAGRKKGEMFW